MINKIILFIKGSYCWNYKHIKICKFANYPKQEATFTKFCSNKKRKFVKIQGGIIMFRKIKPNLDSKGSEVLYIGKDLNKLGLKNGEKYIIRKYKLNKFKNKMIVVLQDHNVRHKFDLNNFYVSC